MQIIYTGSEFFSAVNEARMSDLNLYKIVEYGDIRWPKREMLKCILASYSSSLVSKIYEQHFYWYFFPKFTDISLVGFIILRKFMISTIGLTLQSSITRKTKSQQNLNCNESETWNWMNVLPIDNLRLRMAYKLTFRSTVLLCWMSYIKLIYILQKSNWHVSSSLDLWTLLSTRHYAYTHKA